MAYSLTDSLRQNRFTVVEVDKARGRLRVKNAGDVCTDVTCGGGVTIVADEEQTQDLDKLNPGDIITMEQKDGRAQHIVVVRHMYEEYSSPEW